jgi:uncharacterized small protein (DUF1192 family)
MKHIFTIGNSVVIVIIRTKGKEIMFDEEGRKIDLGMQVGMPLEGMSVEELEAYILALKAEIKRVETEKEKLETHNAQAEALFK